MRTLAVVPVEPDQRDDYVRAVVPYLQELRPGWQPTPEWQSEYVAEVFGEQHRWIWWALDPDGQRVGFANFCAVHALLEGTDWIGEIAELCIFPPYRRLGYGVALARLVLDELRRFGAKEVESTVAADRPDVGAFWEVAGFAPASIVLRARIS